MKVDQLLNKDKNNLDLIRILLACLVIVGHSVFLNGQSGIWVDPIKYFFSYTYSGSLSVKLFFFISGFVVTNSYIHKKSASYFIFARFFRIIPALFFLLLITVFLIGPLLTNLDLLSYFSQLNKLEYLTGNLIFNTKYDLPGVFENNFYPKAING